MHFLGCDISIPLPKSVFLPHPFGIIVHGSTKIGNDVVIGHQVTLGGRDLNINSAPDVGDGERTSGVPPP